MTKKINTELQELIQYIETNYQKGVDFIIPYLDKEYKTGAIRDLSPKLKKYLREYFNIPAGVNDYLDYSKGGEDGKNRVRYYYRVEEKDKGEFEGLYWYSPSWKLKEEAAKKCVACGELTLEENGRFWVWDERVKGFEESLRHLTYLHPKCAKRYFSSKEPIPLIKARHQKVKEILLRNLDKICLDPRGYFANIEYLKTDKAEEEYEKAMRSAYATEWRNRYMNLVIDGEEVDLEDFDNVDEYFEVKRELVRKIKSEIKQNPSEWKIEKGINYLVDQSRNQLVKHQPSGRRYWKIGISEMRGKDEWKVEGKQDWTEIEVLINGSTPNKSNQPTNTELENIKNIFQKLDIKKASFKNGELVIKYNNNNNNKIITNNQLTNNSEYQVLKNYCQELPEKEITKEQLFTNSDNLQSNPNKNNHYLAIGLTLGAGTIALVSILVCLWKPKKNKH